MDSHFLVDLGSMQPITLLVLASFGLLVGPLCGSLGARLRPVHAVVDGFALTLVGGLCIFFILPHTVAEVGWVAVLLALIGAALPIVGHRLWSTTWSLGVVVVALSAHAVLDGAALAVRGDHSPLAWAVVAHRLPVGFALVVAANTLGKGTKIVWGLVSILVAATVIGYFAGPTVVAWLPSMAPSALEALVAGVLLHVVIRPHGAATSAKGCSHHAHAHEGHHDHHHHETHDTCSHHHREPVGSKARPGSPPETWCAAAGALVGLFALFTGATAAVPHEVQSDVSTFLRTLGVLVLESAPALLLGYALAGVIPFLLTMTTMSSLARGGRLMQSLRGVAFGLPIPVCSCGVLPLYESLVRRGAPPIAAMAFFVATPELGLDAVLLSVPLLGGSLTVARVVSAFAVALLVALLVGGGSTTTLSGDQSPADDVASPSWSARVRAGLRFGFVEVFDHTMPWIALGLIVAAMAEPILAHGAIEGVPWLLQVPVAAVVGIPIYVCASGATPVAALALHKGLSAGAAVAFLIAGPATNLTTFGVLARLHGRRTAIRFAGAVTILAVVAGWIVDILGVSAVPVLDAHVDAGAHGTSFAWVCVGGLVALMLASLFRQGPRGALQQITEPIHAD